MFDPIYISFKISNNGQKNIDVSSTNIKIFSDLDEVKFYNSFSIKNIKPNESITLKDVT